MGLYIHLIVNSRNIPQQQWENTYLESIALLHQFPAKLMRFDVEEPSETDGQKRYRYTTALIQHEGTSEEQWIISGDRASGKHAESFAFPRHLKHTQDNDDADILWVDDDALDDLSGNGVDLFGSKSQGYPYHLAVLAVGILVENRFPGSAFVIGDIDSEQATVMTAWVGSVLSMRMQQPVCFDCARLYARLYNAYDDCALTIYRFQTLCLEDERIKLKALLEMSDRNQVLKYIEEELCHYSALNQFGSQDIIKRIVEVTQDIELLIATVRNIVAHNAEKATEFNLETLLTLLVKHMITIDQDKAQPITQLTETVSKMGNIEHVMGETMMKLLGLSLSYIDYYLSSESLLDIFSSYAPEKRQDFEKIVLVCERCCHEQLDECRERIEKIEMETKQEDIVMGEIPAIAQSEQALFNTSYTAVLSESEQYIISEVSAQRPLFEDPIQTARHVGEDIQRAIEAQPEQVMFKTVDQILGFIYRSSVENSIVLSENTWRQIDKISDLDLLRALLLLMLIHDCSGDFRDWRIYVLEHPALWQYLVDPKVRG